jgi:hypothetical protein
MLDGPGRGIESGTGIGRTGIGQQLCQRAPYTFSADRTEQHYPNSARALVPDGSSLFQTWSGDTEKWYELIIEPGKTYVIEALDPNGDYPNGSVDGLGVFALDGVSAPLETTQVCGTSGFGSNSGAPGLSNFAYRCIVRTHVPAFANTQDKRKLYIKVVGLGVFPVVPDPRSGVDDLRAVDNQWL